MDENLISNSQRSNIGPIKALASFSCLSQQPKIDFTTHPNLKKLDSRIKHRLASPGVRSRQNIVIHRSSSSDAILLHYLSGEWPKSDVQPVINLQNKTWRNNMTVRYGRSLVSTSLNSPIKKNMTSSFLLFNRTSYGSNEHLNQELERLSLDNDTNQMVSIPDGHRCPVDELLSIGTPLLHLPPSLISCYLRPPSENSTGEDSSEKNEANDSTPMLPVQLRDKVKQVLPKKNLSARLDPEGAETTKKEGDESKPFVTSDDMSISSSCRKEVNIPSGRSAFDIYPSILKTSSFHHPQVQLCLPNDNINHLHHF